MHKPIVLALQAKNSAMVEKQIPNQLNPCPKINVPKLSCPTMPSKTKTFESINFEDAKEQRLKTIPKTLQILFKKASQSRKKPSWVVLRGKERRKNIRQIMQTLGCRKVINPYSAEQLQSFKNALEEHGQEEDMNVITEPTTSSNAQIMDFQELGFDFGSEFGNDCGNSEFLELEKEVEYGNVVMRNRGCKNRGVDDSRYKLNDLMQLSSVEEVLDEFSKGKLL